MLSTIISLLFMAGIALAIKGGIDLYRKKFGFGRFDFTGASEIVKLRELNRRIRTDLNQTLKNGRNCFKVYSILLSTRYRDFDDSLVVAADDDVWLNARELTLKSAQKGFRNCNRLLRITLDEPDVLLMREAFVYAIETCLNCPILECRGHEIKKCPVVQSAESNVNKNG